MRFQFKSLSAAIVAVACLWMPGAIAVDAGAPPVLRILSDADVERYQRIFRLQDAGKWGDADRVIRQLQDRLLLGHVRFQRLMHPTAYKSSFAELRNWLASYNDLPEAYRVFSLAIKRRPKGAPEPKRPVYGQVHILQLVGEAPERPAAFIGPSEKLKRSIVAHIRKGRNQAAEKQLFAKNARRLLKPLQQDALAAELAMGYFVDGKDRAAYRLASGAAKRSGAAVAKAEWTAGLAAYRLGWIEKAIGHFQNNALAEGVRTWRSASGAFWAGRIMLALKDYDGANHWLGIAARHPRTFYGQLAMHALGVERTFDWRGPKVDAATIGRLKASKAGKRALALLQMGQHWRADQELQPLVENLEPAALMDVVAVATAYGAPRAAVHGAHRLDDDFETEVVPAAYPVAPWLPKPEHDLDRALSLAFMRQESQFNPRAVSPAGARGLMQLLPSTANYVLKKDRYVKARRDLLFDPQENLDVGLRYIRYLMQKSKVDGGLFHLAIAYNGGIGNLARWLKEVRHNGDPILFIEAIPARETRRFVARVMANLWIYRERLGQPTPSRDDVAQGRWPRYVAQD